MDRQTRISLKSWLRAIGYTCFIVSVLVLLYEAIMYLRFGAWDSVSIAEALLFLDWDEIYVLPSEANYPLLHKFMAHVFNVPIWIIGIGIAIVTWMLVGGENKDEAV